MQEKTLASKANCGLQNLSLDVCGSSYDTFDSHVPQARLRKAASSVILQLLLVPEAMLAALINDFNATNKELQAFTSLISSANDHPAGCSCL